MRLITFYLLSSILLFACQNANQSNLINKAQSVLAANPSQDNAESLITAIINEYEKVDDKPSKLKLLNEALDVAKEYNLKGQISSLQLGIVTEEPLSEEAGDILYNMAASLKEKGKLDISDIMFMGIANDFPALSEMAKEQIQDPSINPDTLISNLGESIFPKDNPSEMNKVAAHKYIDICEAYALANPSSEKSVDYLFKGVQMSRSLNSFKKSMSLCDMIIKKYPNDKKAASALFVKGFIMENNYKQTEEAKKLYLHFLEKYPNDELADDVETLLNNLGKSDEELFNSIRK